MLNKLRKKSKLAYTDKRTQDKVVKSFSSADVFELNARLSKITEQNYRDRNKTVTKHPIYGSSNGFESINSAESFQKVKKKI